MCNTTRERAKITFHADLNNYPRLAVNVKDQTLWAQDPRTAKFYDELSEGVISAIYEGICEDFWSTHAQEISEGYGFGQVFSEGRSSGWLVVENTPDLSMCDPCYGDTGRCTDCELWLAFVADIEACIKGMGEEFIRQLAARCAEVDANIVRGEN
jgi:hypothetical protein